MDSSRLSDREFAAPAVTVVMPAFNAARFIAEAIESVVAQSFTDWELIVADDGSTDRTPEIVGEYERRFPGRIRLLPADSPSGSAYQPRKRAIMAARGAVVSPLDADDLIAPDTLERLMAKKQATGAGIVWPAMHPFADTPLGAPRLLPADMSLTEGVRRGRDLVALTLDGWRINCNGGVIDRTLYLDAFSRYDSTLTHACADELLTRQLLYDTPAVAFSDAPYYYRRNEASITRRKSMKLFDILINHAMLHSFVSERYDRRSETRLLVNRQVFHGVFDALRTLDRYGFTPQESLTVYPMIERIVALIDRELIRPSVSRKYYYSLFLLRHNLPLLRRVVRVGDKILSLVR